MPNKITIIIISTALLGLLQLGGVVSSFSNKALDLLFLLRGSLQPSQEIVIIGIDDASLANLGTWPFPRKHHAKLLTQLSLAKVIGFDVLFSESTGQDDLLSAAFTSSPPVILATTHTYQHHILQPPPSLSGYSGIGHIEIVLSRDGIVRKAYAFQQLPQNTMPAFALAILEEAKIKTDLTPSSKPLLINHYGPEITFLYLSYLDVLRGEIPKDFFKDRFVLIGAKATGFGDSHITPFSTTYPTPGIEIQATILNNLLHNTILTPLPGVSWGVTLCFALLTLFALSNTGDNRLWLLTSSLTAGVLLCSYFLFLLSFFFNPVPPLFFLGTCSIVYLLMERFWTAKNIFNEMIRLDQQLETQLQGIYTNIPTKFFNLQKSIPASGGIRKHLSHLQAGVKVLNIQHHFIENLLQEELPPLILWDRHSGIVIIANTMFSTFWDRHSPKKSTLPTLDQFINLIQNTQLDGKNYQPDIDALRNNTQIAPIDIELTEHGLTRYYRINIHPYTVADIEFSGVLAILTDVTEIKELEQLKDTIVSVVSHELKLPLTVILGYGEMLADTLEKKEKEYIDEICSQTQKLNKLIENFLDVARIEQNRQEIKRFPLDLILLLEKAQKSVLIPAEKKSITIQSHLPFRTTPLIGDYTLLFQAVVNLLDNAIKFSPDNTQITITLTEETHLFTICISDQGPGVPDDFRGAIYDKFNRGQHTLTDDGFGLGLSFVKQVAQKHNGKLWLEPQTDQGAIFCISLAKYQEN